MLFSNLWSLLCSSAFYSEDVQQSQSVRAWPILMWIPTKPPLFIQHCPCVVCRLESHSCQSLFVPDKKWVWNCSSYFKQKLSNLSPNGGEQLFPPATRSGLQVRWSIREAATAVPTYSLNSVRTSGIPSTCLGRTLTHAILVFGTCAWCQMFISRVQVICGLLPLKNWDIRGLFKCF